MKMVEQYDSKIATFSAKRWKQQRGKPAEPAERSVRFEDAAEKPVGESTPQPAACKNSLAFGVPFLRGKSDSRTDQPISSGRKQINPSSLHSHDPPEWTKLIPQLLEDCRDMNAGQAISRLKDMMTKASEYDYWNTEEGQSRLEEMSKDKDKQGLNIFDDAPTSRASLSPMSNADLSNEWIEVELTADTGACDTVIPKKMCPGIPIVPSMQSLKGLEYEVATGE
jgi:hypothetical protein